MKERRRTTIVFGSKNNPIIFSKQKAFDAVNLSKNCDIVIYGSVLTSKRNVLRCDGGDIYVYGDCEGVGIETTNGNFFCNGSMTLGGHISVNGNFECKGNLQGNAYNIEVAEKFSVSTIKNVYRTYIAGNFSADFISKCYELAVAGNFVCKGDIYNVNHLITKGEFTCKGSMYSVRRE